MSKKKIIIAIVAINLLATIGFTIFIITITTKPELFAKPDTVEKFIFSAMAIFTLLFIATIILINILKGKILSNLFSQITIKKANNKDDSIHRYRAPLEESQIKKLDR